MLGRVGVLALLLLVLVGLWLGVRGWAYLRRSRRLGRVRAPELADGKPTIVFFTADYCTVCRYRQKPALDALQGERNGGLRVVEMDAVAQPEAARRFGVLSLPTTAVLAPDGTVEAINYGFAPRDQLDAQLKSLPA
jgi:thiol-disulfide isomerase/thioredoxin